MACEALLIFLPTRVVPPEIALSKLLALFGNLGNKMHIFLFYIGKENMIKEVTLTTVSVENNRVRHKKICRKIQKKSLPVLHYSRAVAENDFHFCGVLRKDML